MNKIEKIKYDRYFKNKAFAKKIMNSKRIFLFLILTNIFIILSLSSVNASDGTLGIAAKGTCIDLRQVCTNCTYNNISSVIYPNRSVAIIGQNMTRKGNSYNYTFCDTSVLGDYVTEGYGDLDGESTPWIYDFQITEGGDTFSSSQPIMFIGLLGIIGLLFGIGLTFKQEKWKMKSFFFMTALAFGVVLLNSIRLVIGTSTNLSKMGNISLIIGIVVLSFMIAYMLVMYTIEAFHYFKDKKSRKWEVSEE